jgi:hypothetical protein
LGENTKHKKEKKTPKKRWGRACKILEKENLVGNTFFTPSSFYSEFWKLKGWRINFNNNQN